MSSVDGVRASIGEDGGVLEIVIDVPKGNVLTAAVMRALDHHLVEHIEHRTLRLVTVRGEGRHFSFGASVEEHRRETVANMLSTFHSLVRRVASYPIPIAAVIDGRCLGGAFELALACHFVLATRSAIFACPEINLGVIPPVLAALGPTRLGGALTERLLLTGAELDAESARVAGLVTAIAPEGVAIEVFALEWYRNTLAPLSAAALRQGVRAVRRGMRLEHRLGETLDAIEGQYLHGIVPSYDGNEGIEAFIARRPPVWRHQ